VPNYPLEQFNNGATEEGEIEMVANIQKTRNLYKDREPLSIQKEKGQFAIYWDIFRIWHGNTRGFSYNINVNYPPLIEVGVSRFSTAS